MSTRTAVSRVDAATVDRLSDGLRRCIENGEAGDDVFAPDAFFDLFPPFWRFQIQGVEAITAQLRAVADGRRTQVTVLRTVPTATGFVTEHEERAAAPSGEGGVETARHLWLCEVRDGRIVEALNYCNGGWDEELRARHAAEAPMLRP